MSRYSISRPDGPIEWKLERVESRLGARRSNQCDVESGVEGAVVQHVNVAIVKAHLLHWWDFLSYVSLMEIWRLPQPNLFEPTFQELTEFESNGLGLMRQARDRFPSARVHTRRTLVHFCMTLCRCSLSTMTTTRTGHLPLLTTHKPFQINQ